MGGALKGLFQMRDGNNGEYFNGTTTEVIYGKDIIDLLGEFTDPLVHLLHIVGNALIFDLIPDRSLFVGFRSRKR